MALFTVYLFVALVALCSLLTCVCVVQTAFIVVVFLDKYIGALLCSVAVYMIVDCFFYHCYNSRRDDRCPICLGDTDECEFLFFIAPSQTLECGHRFHARCIERWLDVRDTCPCCRRRCASWES